MEKTEQMKTECALNFHLWLKYFGFRWYHGIGHSKAQLQYMRYGFGLISTQYEDRNEFSRNSLKHT